MSTEILQGVLIVIAVVLVIVLAYESVQYKKFLLAHRSLMAMGVGMQKGFENVVEHLNKLNYDTIELKQGSALTDQELTVVRTILGIHSEQLGIKTLNKMFNLVDKLKTDGNAELEIYDPSREV